MDADILVSLKPSITRPGLRQGAARSICRANFRGTLLFLSADIISQIFNFGLPAPIDVQVVGQDVDENRIFADHLLDQIRTVPGAVDMRIQQLFDLPTCICTWIGPKRLRAAIPSGRRQQSARFS